MPIRPENKSRYPSDWREISHAIRERSGGRCECTGECGVRQHTHGPQRCTEEHNQPARRYPHSRIILTTAHLNHRPEDCRPANLRAFCQRCHLLYDQDHHERQRRANRDLEAGQGLLFEI